MIVVLLLCTLGAVFLLAFAAFLLVKYVCKLKNYAMSLFYIFVTLFFVSLLTLLVTLVVEELTASILDEFQIYTFFLTLACAQAAYSAYLMI